MYIFYCFYGKKKILFYDVKQESVGPGCLFGKFSKTSGCGKQSHSYHWTNKTFFFPPEISTHMLVSCSFWTGSADITCPEKHCQRPGKNQNTTGSDKKLPPLLPSAASHSHSQETHIQIGADVQINCDVLRNALSPRTPLSLSLSLSACQSADVMVCLQLPATPQNTHTQAVTKSLEILTRGNKSL